MIAPRVPLAWLPLSLLLLAACSNEPHTPDGRTFPATACGEFGVTEGVPVPDTCPLEIAQDGDEVRVFAVGAIPRYAEMETYADFCKAWDTVVRTQVLPCLREDRPNLLVLPENATLSAAFIGSRGASGRAATDTLTGFLGFFGSYIDPLNYYREKFPGRDDQALVMVALTDTFHRAFQTFPAIARTYGVALAVSADFAPAERSDDPAVVAALADPDLPDASEVWVATEGAASNWGVVFDPEGAEVGRVAKTYLVPDEEDLLRLAHGSLTQMRPLQLPGSWWLAGMVISKDAWMPNVLERLDLEGASLMLQPEAFSGWGVTEYEGDWLPDVVKGAGWAQVQRSGSFRYNVTPCLKGNLLGLAYDCQSHIAKHARSDDPPMSFVGQDPYAGLLAVEPWVVADPGPPESLEARRTALRAVGEALLPGSGDPREDGYVNQVVAADLGAGLQAYGDGTPGPLGASRLPLSEEAGTGSGPGLGVVAYERRPDLAAEGDRVLLVYQEGGNQIGGALRLAVSEDGGESWTENAAFAELNPMGRAPKVAQAGARWIVVSEWGKTAVSLDAGTTWADAGLATGWEPAAAVDPVTGRFFVAWLDLRHGDHPKPYLAFSDDGSTWTEVRVDPSNAIEDNPRGDAAFVSVSARDGQVTVSFTDFRAYSWDVYAATSTDGGATFQPVERLNPPAATLTRTSDGAQVEAERLHADPHLARTSEGAPFVVWADQQDRRPDSRIRLRLGEDTVRVDDGTQGAFRPAAVATTAGVVVVWQEVRDGTAQIRLARGMGSPLAFEPSLRVDDAPDGAAVVSPAVAQAASGTVIAYEAQHGLGSRIRLVLDRR